MMLSIVLSSRIRQRSNQLLERTSLTFVMFAFRLECQVFKVVLKFLNSTIILLPNQDVERELPNHVAPHVRTDHEPPSSFCT